MSYIEKELEIKKLAKRMQKLTAELELAHLDLASYASPLSKGQFPSSWSKEANKTFAGYATELTRISAKFTELFKESIDAQEEVVAPVKRKKK